MEEVAFSDWPGQPVDLNSGNNPWMPAYGFQTPSALLDRDDFIGNPDAGYFLDDHAGQYVYLETILEETSEDLRSDESDLDSRGSPAGWLATDSEAGSVICIEAPDDAESESDREIACPAKRRRHDFVLEEELSCLSRSSSLLQFESLEKQCQETCNSSPSVYSQYSFDSLEGGAAAEEGAGCYETSRTDAARRRRETSRDSLLYDASRYSGSESGDSDATLDTSRSTDNLKTWRSCDSLPHAGGRGSKEKASVENLSEDSGYGDHLSAPHPQEKLLLDRAPMKGVPEKRSSCVGFTAYDGEFTQDNFTGNFGVSYRDLTSFKDHQLDRPKTSPSIDHLNSKKRRSPLDDDALKLAARRHANFKPSTSEPDLLQTASEERTARVSSVPEDLDFIGEFAQSAASKEWNLPDLRFDYAPELDDMSYYKREGSYSEAMSNRVDLSDDERSLYNKRRAELPKSPIVEFDRRVLKAISEQSLQSILSGSQNPPQQDRCAPKQQRCVASTPDLAVAERKYFDDDRRRSVQDVRRKGSIIKSSTSTSGMSDGEEKAMGLSKGVHFSPVVSELNWRDDSVSTVTPDRESSYSLGSSSPERRPSPPAEAVRPTARLSCSQPDLSDNDSCRREFVHSLRSLREDAMSKSQPDVNKLRRRGSQLIKKDKDGSVIKAYVDGDGIRYQHTHLDIGIGFGPHRAPAAAAIEADRRDDAGAPPVDAMHAHGAIGAQRARKPGKIDRFFARLAGLRFGLKRGAEGKGTKKAARGDRGPAPNAFEQRVATKDDYIYIPLKGPAAREEEEDPARRQHVTAKPPLPRQPPPRVVHASVKAQAGVESSGRSHRRRTIDGPAAGAAAAAAASMEPMGLIETDLDTEVTVITTGGPHAKTRSLLDLARPPARHRPAPAAGLEAEAGGHGRPHKSMEFLLDKQNLRVVEPPENELRKGERVMSEHQLRVQRSLQKLTIPEWYKPSQVPREGFLLKKHQPSPSRDTRWTGTGGRTTSLNSLGSAHRPPALSPTPSGQPFVRWSTSKLNSAASSPCASTRSSFKADGSLSPASARSSFSYRQPYLGWRSQERLSRPRTPAERLASSMLSCQGTPEIQTSIKEVTSAIVHYVSGLRPDDREAASPRGSQQLCWVESSFVGSRPPEAPRTPVEGGAPAHLRLDLHNHNDLTAVPTVKPSPSSTTLEDVLDSLLGLPSTGRAPSPSLQETVSANTSPSHRSRPSDQADQYRRRSEGSEPVQGSLNNSRRASSPQLRCRYSRCGKTASAASPEADAFKNCHNCSYTYCSRTCRRAHWEKHRKTCLFSRTGTLCRQVIAAAKEQKDTLAHLSQMSRRGYRSHGNGAVKCFFPNPEAAETFLAGGLSSLGELTYVRWQDLLPSEMGPQMYAELVKMCRSYNPDAKFVLYVSVCVVSETPATGSVRWERQLVSRCAKMRLSKDQPPENAETVLFTSVPVGDDPLRVRELRRISVDRLQSHLRARGVSLEGQYPEILKQLGDYCSDPGVRFTPLTVYPRDSVTGKSLMCIVMLEADRESLKEVANAGVKVRTVDLMKDVCI